MSEIQPQVLYTPDGTLRVRTEVTDSHSEEALEHLKAWPGVDLDDGSTIQVNVKKALGSDFGNKRAADTREFLVNVGDLLPPYPEEKNDRVVNPLWLRPVGIEVAIYPHFQRWLNSQNPLDGNITAEAMLAMAIPFGERTERQTRRRLTSNQNKVSPDPFDISVTLSASEFDVLAAEKTDDDYIKKEGVVTWNQLTITTLGNCACLEVDAETRKHIYTGDDWPYTWLYEMVPHNIDSPHQTLSMLLGLGSLAYHASQYPGREDVFEHVEWTKSENYPRT